VIPRGVTFIRTGALDKVFPATFPSGEGSDFAGEIVSVREDVERFAVGDAVLGWTDEPRRTSGGAGGAPGRQARVAVVGRRRLHVRRPRPRSRRGERADQYHRRPSYLRKDSAAP